MLTTSKEYLVNMNRLERDYRFMEVYVDRQKEVDATVTSAIFSAEGIRARLKALMIIDLYVARLAEIVNADSNDRLTKKIDAFEDDLHSLGSHIEKINGDKTIGKYAPSVTDLVKCLSLIWLEQEKKKALKLAVTEAAPAVDTILSLLEEDLKQATQDRQEYVLMKYNNLRIKYNKERKNLTDNERKARIEELKTLYDSYEILCSSDPEGLIGSMRSAHDSMVQMVQNLGDQHRYKAVAGAVDVFYERVNEAAAVYKAFKELSK
ncbi:MAG: hypothetical protein HGA81_09180 [Chlorobium limicola]|nr:hypothetical protein [Chlorobium limicola]